MKRNPREGGKRGLLLIVPCLYKTIILILWQREALYILQVQPIYSVLQKVKLYNVLSTMARPMDAKI